MTPVLSIKRGVLAGATGGLAYGLFVALVATPFVAAIETAGHEQATAHSPAVTETTTVLSIGAGVLWGLLLGAVFGLAYYLLEPALPGGQPFRPYILAGAGFLTVSGVPWLVLPPAVPGAEHVLSVHTRLVLYGGLVCVGAMLSTGCLLTYQKLAQRTTGWYALAGSLGPLVAVMATVAVMTPGLTTGTADMPALTAAFRSTTVLAQASLWALLAGGYAHLDHGDRAGDAGVTDKNVSSV